MSWKHGKLNIRKSHPTLYHSIMIIGLASVALGFNFWFSNPTFNPYGIDKNLIGLIFFLLGTSKLVLLNVIRNLRAVRIQMAVSIGWVLFWGLSNTQQFFVGNASLQLPIMYMTLALLQIPLLIESHVNPMTEKK